MSYKGIKLGHTRYCVIPWCSTTPSLAILQEMAWKISSWQSFPLIS